MKLHFSGVCGTGMASLAGLMKARGHHVTGSDQDVYAPMSDQLAELGIAVRSPYDARNVPEDAELVVIGNALSRGNPEIEVVLDRKQPMTSMPALLAGEFLRARTSLVVAGTHGKTTTASLLAYLLHACGREPSFLVGGVPVDFGRSHRLGAGPHFVVEGDEYDSAFFDKRPKFVHYLPDVAVVGNVEFDHADIYADLPAVQTAFRRLLGLIPRRGRLIAGAESAALRELLPGAPCRVETFGLGAGCDWSAEGAAFGPDGTRFRLRAGGHDRGEFRTALAGEHNVRNCLGALAAAAAVGLEPEEARAALRAFRGVKRRLELRGRVAGTALYDDFAHHPTAVRETLRALRALDPPEGDGRVFAVFEPRSYTSRTSVFQDDFGRALAAADRVIVAAAHLPGKVPEGQRVSEQDLVAAARACGAEARFIPGVEAIVAAVADEARAGDRIVILSNGAFGRIHERLLEALRRRAPGPRTPAVV